ncbi:Cyclolysin [Thalassovita gelatinovora]|uniref:Cyclolysin n=1 Tax=Thalassovita gelatinovora TaxID=53501 RepID=A0A0P1FJL7_THAGE|nr:calcium-binding protein [Thalassovita gelatinovora]CUH68239.1 Cyclolysin [Thalassovita gelatinovora]SEQ31864.1 Hemolysin-type calcium-binding repeat-containing protein [Thalassovita gelatinovora]
MLLTYNGYYQDFLGDAFFNSSGEVDVDLTVNSASEFLLEQPTTGIVTTVTGSGFTFSGDDPTGGTITGMSFATSGSDTIATVSGINWGLVEFNNALGGIEADNPALLANLFNSAGPITIDASSAVGGLSLNDFEDLSPFITANMTVNGTDFNDTLIGGAGNDTINPGANEGYDRLHGTAGNDVYDFAQANENSYYEIEYDLLSSGITATVDAGARTASVTGADGTDTFNTLAPAMTAENGGFGIIGTTHNDTFTITSAADAWVAVSGGAGNDTFNLTLNNITRLFFGWDGVDGATQGMVADLSTGVVSNDGLGGTDQINILGGDQRLEIGATDYNDSITGSDRDESFILERGDDTLDGGAGYDRVRYDRSGVTAVNVDLEAGMATGQWDGNGFTHHLSNIEDVRGSRTDNDTLLGGAGDETLDGRGGHDILDGRAGNDWLFGADGFDSLSGGAGDDWLYGGDGVDTLIGGTGQDHLFGGSGNDLLDGSAGDATTEGSGDYFRPGEGADTIIGNAALWAAGEGIDLSYADVSGTGGLFIYVNEDGAGNVSSNNVGVSDGFTYAHYFEGSDGADQFTGDNSSGWRGWAGLAGDDTITGGGGTDQLVYRWDNETGGGNAGVSVVFTAEGTGSATDGFGDTDTFTGIEQVQGTLFDDTMTGNDGAQRFDGEGGNDRLIGGEGADTLNGGDGNDTLNGEAGDDVLIGGTSEADLRDVIYGGDGNDSIDGGYGNDELRGDDGSDTIIGGYGVDTVIGMAGDDALTGQAWSDLLYGGDGDDFLNGGFGYDRVNGGAGADRFYHLGVYDHGSDWVQDYTAADGDVLVFGQAGATADQFQVNLTETANAGVAGVEEAFVIYRPTGQIMWALVDGGAQDEINLVLDGVTHDLLA